MVPHIFSLHQSHTFVYQLRSLIHTPLYLLLNYLCHSTKYLYSMAEFTILTVNTSFILFFCKYWIHHVYPYIQQHEICRINPSKYFLVMYEVSEVFLIILDNDDSMIVISCILNERALANVSEQLQKRQNLNLCYFSSWKYKNYK